MNVLISVIIIGFEETNHTVNESMAKLEVYVSVISPPPGVEFFATIVLGIQSVAITASKYDNIIIIMNKPVYNNVLMVI